MKGQLYIDGVDTYSDFGVWITEGGYDDLLSFPALISPDKNVWPEEDGIEVDLSAPALSGREISISFVANNPKMDADEFIIYVSRPGYRIFRIPVLGREWRLRLLSHPDNIVYGTTGSRLVSFTLSFADDFPMRSSEYLPADGCGVYIPPSSYLLDGKNLDRYGIVVEEGRDSILKSAAVKQNLTRKFNTMDGVLYDAGTLVFSEKDVTFKCCLIADTMERFWQCYISFFNDLIKPNERLLGYDETGRNYKCYYKSTSGWKLQSLTGRIIVEFSLTLVFTSFRASGNATYLLATESSAFITTEDDRYIEVPPVYTATNYMPTLNVVKLGTNDTEIRKCKITEMPVTSSLEGLYMPAVDMSNQNVRIAASLLKGDKGESANIKITSAEAYNALPVKQENTLYACLDKEQGVITKAYIGIYPFLISGGLGQNEAFTYTLPLILK